MKKILVVDDEAISALFLGSALEEEGFEVRVVTRAEEALIADTEFHPDFLITDWMLKDAKDGVQVATTLLSRNPNLKVIFVTGMAQEMLKTQAANIHYQAIIVKPVDIDAVVQLLRSPPVI